MARRSLILLCLTFLSSFALTAAETGESHGRIDLAVARNTFDEAEAICREDDGALWGVSLCGPILLVDPESRAVVANQPDEDGKLEKRGDVFVGQLPPEKSCANTAMRWAGVYWTMLLWPLPEEPNDRARLVVHELFHRVQETIDLPMSNPTNAHLDDLEGRVWLQLEWRALGQAFRTGGEERTRAIENALLFRDHRRSLFADAMTEETLLELNEGLAEYTGVRLSGLDDPREMMAARLDASQDRKGYSRSFAYVSGPAWGLLLDSSPDTDWRGRISAACSFECLARQAWKIEPTEIDEAARLARAERFGYQEVLAREQRREEDRRERLAQYDRILVNGQTLTLPLTGDVQYSFNPNEIEALDADTIIYPSLRVSDRWGILSVTGGALMKRIDGRAASVTVSAPTDDSTNRIEGEGWTLDLEKGWRIASRDDRLVLESEALGKPLETR